MITTRKFEPGAPLHTMAAFAYHLEQGRHFYFRGKFQHNGWARGWPVGWAMAQVHAGTIRVAQLVEVPDGLR